MSDSKPAASSASPIERLRGVRRIALQLFVLGSVGIAIAYASAFGSDTIASAGVWLMSLALPTTMLALMTFGAVRSGRPLGALATPFALVLLLVGGGFVLALALPPDGIDGVYWLGLPRRAAVIVYGVGILPLFVLPLAYAFTFDTATLSEADIERVRAARSHAARADSAASPQR